MKTLKFFLLAIIFATVTNVATAKNYNDTRADQFSKLTSTLKQIIKSDFQQLDNYFQQNQIERIKEDVLLTFCVTKDSKLKILSAECENKEASAYLIQLLNNQKVFVNESMKQKNFKLNVKIEYRS
jgi:hypothetical protein